MAITDHRLSAIGQTGAYSETPLPGGAVQSVNGGATGTQLADWLGSIFVFDAGGSYAFGGKHAPFGEYYSGIGPRLAFAGNGGISWGESGDGATMSWFPERDYNSTQARWMTPDPAGTGAVDPSNPQSWNRYAYVNNNPLRYIDPSGLECVWDDGSYDSEFDSYTGSVGGCGSAGGTWAELGQNGNWSNQADQWNQNLVAGIQAGQVGQVDILGLNGQTYSTVYKGAGQTTETITPDATTFFSYGQPVNSVSQMIDSISCFLCARYT